MTIEVTNQKTQDVQEISSRLLTALELLQRGRSTMPVNRARAIAACANEIFNSVKVEAQRSATAREPQ